MNPDKNMEELLTSARELPTELTYNEVEFLFLNPTLPPPAKPWWRGRYPKFLLMFALIIALIGFLLPAQTEMADYQLSAFPVQEETPLYSAVATLPTTSVLTALPSTDVEITTPEVRSTAPKTSPAPAAAPISTTPPATKIAEAPITTNPQPANTRSDGMPPALFQGAYLESKNFLILTFQEHEAKDDAVNLLSFDLTADERRQLKRNEAGMLTIEREAGSLLLYKNGKKGRFEYLPNKEYQASFTAKGWGPADVEAADGFFQVTMGKKEDSSPATRIEDQLWFRYFTTNINTEYLDLLREYGYSDTDFEQLWALANNSITYEKLKTILPLAEAAISDQTPLRKLPGLSNDTDNLKKLRRAGRQMTYEEFDAVKATPSIWETIIKLQNTSVDSLNAHRKRARNRRFSLALPGTASDTIAYTSGQKLQLTGNFEFKISKDPTQDYLVVYGPEKLVDWMQRRSNYKQLKLKNKKKGEPLYVLLPQGANLQHEPSKGVEVTIKTKPKQ